MANQPPPLPPLGHGHIAAGQQPPVVTVISGAPGSIFPDFTVVPGQLADVGGNVYVDGKTITEWAFFDATPGNGDLSIYLGASYGGQKLDTNTGQLGPPEWGNEPAGQVFVIDDYQASHGSVQLLGDNSVSTTGQPVSDTIYAAAWDGSQWSKWVSFDITTIPLPGSVAPPPDFVTP